MFNFFLISKIKRKLKVFVEGGIYDRRNKYRKSNIWNKR
jgi:hypothetical protein